ncbi:DeoR/GlpR family DNA-binding transcription regulator [Pediococcus stilesii]|uniref:DeoR/GlpR family DNA-binding transcription regulator n=1 Tax=Pediococcus stilesii TaxID=331679 RepID=UPI0014866544|nr:DeoR/GlpR family DNA-binding transcription regulator [Pediococcus stilesii]
MKVLTELRERNILDLLKQKQFIKIDEIIEKNNSSVSTVRRDLKKLESEGKLVRIHGGARIESNLQEETDFQVKSKLNLVEKNDIGKKAAELVQEGEVIFLDAGTSTATMISYLSNIKGLLVVTNGLTIANLLSDFDVNTYVVGGLLKNKTRALIGTEVTDRIETFQFDRCFMGVNGISKDQGFTTPDIQEAQIKTLVMNRSRQAYVLADLTKFDHTSFVSFSKLEDATIITDTCPNWIKNKTNVKYMEVNK